jgi:hypothetical protein
MSPSDIIDQQIAAYNARNADDFAATYAEDAHIFMMPNLKLAVRGKSALHAHYAANVFTKEGLRAEVASRVVLGNKVVDHEITHGLAPQPIESLVVYEVADGLIQAVWFYWPNARFQPSNDT